MLSKETVNRLRNAGAEFYDWNAPADLPLAPGETLVRLVTSFATGEHEVTRFSELLAV